MAHQRFCHPIILQLLIRGGEGKGTPGLSKFFELGNETSIRGSVPGKLVISLRGVNYGLWYHFGC